MEENIDNTGTGKDEYYDILTTEESIKDVMHVDKIELAKFLTREEILKIQQEVEQKNED
jgi:hypothetical protein